jgi:hypothetical protein
LRSTSAQYAPQRMKKCDFGIVSSPPNFRFCVYLLRDAVNG